MIWKVSSISAPLWRPFHSRQRNWPNGRPGVHCQPQVHHVFAPAFVLVDDLEGFKYFCPAVAAIPLTTKKLAKRQTRCTLPATSSSCICASVRSCRRFGRFQVFLPRCGGHSTHDKETGQTADPVYIASHKFIMYLRQRSFL